MKLKMRFCQDQAGATAIEYALVGGLVSILIVFGARGIGQRLLEFFEVVAAGF